MSRLARCPNCGENPTLGLHSPEGQRSHYHPFCCGITADSEAGWNRYAKHNRKGRMFEWLERGTISERISTRLDYAIKAARDWWRNRRAR